MVPHFGTKLEVVKQEMARANVNILEIRELKWTGKSEFNSDDHYIYYCGQEYLRRNGVAIIVNKRVHNAVLGCSLRNDTRSSLHLVRGNMGLHLSHCRETRPSFESGHLRVNSI